MIGFRFSEYIGGSKDESTFDKLLKLFKELLIHTNGNPGEALSWLTQIDRQYNLTTPQYGMADFIQDLMDKGFIEKNKKEDGPSYVPTSKMETQLRQHALEDIFDQLQKTKRGEHTTSNTGQGDEMTSELRPYVFGDKLDQISMSETIRNAFVNHGIEEFMMTQDDISVHETYQQSQTSTVLMIDISHSMILYGEDRITPAKKVAMALSELIITRYPKDTLDIIVFGDDAWGITIKDLPYLEVGPYHTNTVAGLDLAMEILRKRKNPNKNIMMITDGKPTCIKKGKKYYKNSFGLDRTILTRTMSLAVKARKMNIPITTFMIARDPYLVQFVDQFTKANGGKAFYSSLQGLGELLFMDYKDHKRKMR